MCLMLLEHRKHFSEKGKSRSHADMVAYRVRTRLPQTKKFRGPGFLKWALDFGVLIQAFDRYYRKPRPN